MKLQIIQKLAEGKDPQEIANLLGVSYAKVIRHKKEYEEARTAGTLNQLLDMDEEIVESIKQTFIENSPTEYAKQIEGTFDKIKGLDVLSDELQQTARTINTRLQYLSRVAADASELSVLVESLCMMQTAFFNRNQVNIQNNFGDSNGQNRYASLLSDVPKVP